MTPPPMSADAILAGYLCKQNTKQQHTKPYKLNSAPAIRRPPSEATFFQQDNETIQQLNETQESYIAQLQRKLLAFFYIYTSIIFSLFLTYALYRCYHQNQSMNREQQQQQAATAHNQAILLAAESRQFAQLDNSQIYEDLQTKLESKIHLLERYIEVLALDLEATKSRLSEREKCACSLPCTFNGTRYADGQTWRSKCDICSCRAGKISCTPRECPKLKCSSSEALQLAGQCCPTCMKKCKVNGQLIKHGDSFKPTASDSQVTSKVCKCHDGLIKCAELRRKSTEVNHNNNNKTMEYLKSILRPPPPPLPIEKLMN